VVTGRPGFDWNGRVAMAPGLPVRVHDAYVAGEGVLRASLLGLFTVVGVRGDGKVAGPVISGGRLAAWVRVLITISGVLSLAGLSGVAVGDMQLRNIGIVGYVRVALVVVVLLAVLFYRTAPQEA
jgi:hypothetical protein